MDQILILQEAAFSRFTCCRPADAAKLLDPVKAQYANETEYRAALARYGITEADVGEQLLGRDARAALHRSALPARGAAFRRRSARCITTRWWRNGAGKIATQIPTFEASREQIEKLLTDQRTAQALDRWLGMQRTETQILYRDAVFQ